MIYKNISAEDFKKALENDDDFIVLDVRTVFEFERGHLDDAILIPHDELIARYPELEAQKDKKIYVICRIGNRSMFAANVLVRVGFTNVVNVLGGYLAL